MEIAEKVRKTLADSEATSSLAKALADAERMADEFPDVKPIPYRVAIERFYGLPVQCEMKGAFGV